MAVFPTFTDDIYSDNPLVDEVRFKTTFTMFGTEGQERRKRQYLHPKRDINLKFSWITKQEARLLWEFYAARSGSFEAFYYVHPFIRTYPTSGGEQFASVCDGESVNFLVPSVGATSYTLYLQGVEQTEGVDYTFYSQGGIDGIDYVQMDVAPTAGHQLTWAFTGQLATRCRFEEDNLTFETFYNRLAKMGLKLKGLLFSDELGFATVTTTTTTTSTTTTTT